MTSTISCKKTSKYASVFGWTLRKSLAIMVVCGVLLFLAFPLIMILARSITELNYGGAAVRSESIITGVTRGMYGSAFTAIVMLFSIIAGAKSFSYMHTKRSVDMFGALPVNRRTMFFSRMCGAVATVLIPTFLVTVVGILCLIPYGNAILATVNYLIYITLAVIATIVFMGMLALCCGTTADTIISFIVISLVYPAVVAFCTLLPTSVVPGLVTVNFDVIVYTALCPVVSAFVAFAKGAFSSVFIGYSSGDDVSSQSFSLDIAHMIYWIIFIVVCCIVSYFISKKRKAESAQSGFAFRLPQVIIRVLASFIGGGLVGLCFAAVFSSSLNSTVVLQYTWFWVGMLVGSFCANLVLQVLYHRGFKGFGKSLIYYGATIFASVVLFIVMVTGLMGADTYVPKASDVKSVKFDTDNIYYINSNDSELEEQYIADKNFISDVTNLHKDITTSIKQDGKYPYSIFETSDVLSSTYYEPITITYVLNNGSTVSREYMSSDIRYDYTTMINKIKSNTEYIKNISKIDDLENTAQINSMELTEAHDSQYNLSITDKYSDTLINQFIAAYKKDLNSDTNSTDSSIEYSFSISFMYPANDQTQLKSAIIYVKSNYVNTISVLNKMGLNNQEFLNDMQSSEGNNTEDKIDGYIYVNIADSWLSNGKVYCKLYDSNDLSSSDKLFNIYQEGEHIKDNIYKFPVKALTSYVDNDWQKMRIYIGDSNDLSTIKYSDYGEFQGLDKIYTLSKDGKITGGTPYVQ